MVDAIKTFPLSLPKEYESYSVGFSIDIGGSVAKVVYRPKEDCTSSGGELNFNNKSSRLRVAMIDRDDVTTLVSFIKKYADVQKTLETSEDSLTCMTTGVGMTQYQKDIEKQLNIKCSNQSELTVAGKAFLCLLKHLPGEEMFCPLSRAGFDRAHMIASQWAQTHNNMVTLDGDWGVTDSYTDMSNCDEMYAAYGTDNDCVFPCLLVVAGSGTALLEVHEDGKCEAIDVSTIAGKTFLALGELLTGAKTYDELATLASQGSYTRCSTLMGDMVESDNGDLYSALPTEALAYTFGKIIGLSKGEVRKEDIAATLLQMIFECLSQCAILNAISRNISQVYFTGSFLNHEAVREALTVQFLERAYRLKDKPVTMKILELGAYYPAIGAWIHGSEQELKKS